MCGGLPDFALEGRKGGVLLICLKPGRNRRINGGKPNELADAVIAEAKELQVQHEHLIERHRHLCGSVPNSNSFLSGSSSFQVKRTAEKQLIIENHTLLVCPHCWTLEEIKREYPELAQYPLSNKLCSVHFQILAARALEWGPPKSKNP
jgi:hypothetical protein